MTKASSENLTGNPALSWLGELSAARPDAAIRLLGRRDESNATAHAAYTLGRQRGYEAGFLAGREAGFSDGSKTLRRREFAEAQAAATHLHELLDKFQEQLTALESQVASDLVSLSIDIARQVLRRELALTPESLIPVAAEALRALGEGASQIELRVNPGDEALLKPHLESLPNGQRCRLKADPSLMPGGLRVEADSGVVDASFEARWQAVMSNLGRDEEPLP